MKNYVIINRSKIVLLIFIFVVTPLSILLLNEKKVHAENIIRVAVAIDNLILPIDPIKNPTLTNAFFVNHLYSNLVEVDLNNKYVPDTASKFYWDEDVLVFEFDESRNIGAHDAELSLKRTFYSEENDHGDLWRLLCNEQTESIEECLQQISVLNGKLRIRVRNSRRQSALVPLLASINYKIVPIEAFDSKDPKLAKIIRYDVTSGKYFLKESISKVLFLNNYAISKNYPRIVEIVSANPTNIIELVKNRKIDIISSTIPITHQIFSDLNEEGWQFDGTYNISIGLIVFSEKYISKTTAKERFSIAKILSNEINKTKIFKSVESYQIYQDFGNGYLDEFQSSEVTKAREATGAVSEIPTSLSVRNKERWALALKEFKNILVDKIKINPISQDEEKRPDLFLISNDVSFETNFSLFSFLVKNKIFKRVDFDNAFRSYLELEDEQERIKFLNKIHFENLIECFVYPLWASPYFTVTKPTLASKNSKYNSRTLVWNITKIR